MTAQGPGTVAKALDVLGLLGDFPEGATAAEIANLSGFPFSTAYRLLGALVESGFADYDPGTKRYALGLRVYQLSQKVAHARRFDGAARRVLEQLTAETQESSILAVRDGHETVTVLTVDGPDFRITTDPGERGPLHTSAIGQALLAWTPDREELIEALDLAPRTERSLTDPAALRERLSLVRQRGWAAQSEENDAGMLAIAAPVVTANDRLIASLGLAAPLFRHDLSSLEAHAERLRAAAEELALILPER